MHKHSHEFKTDSARGSNNECKKLKIYQKSNHGTVTLGILFKTTHFSSFLQVTPCLNSQAFSRKLVSNLVRMLKACNFVFSINAKGLFLEVSMSSS